jgi:hypothetical protein
MILYQNAQLNEVLSTNKGFWNIIELIGQLL